MGGIRGERLWISGLNRYIDGCCVSMLSPFGRLRTSIPPESQLESLRESQMVGCWVTFQRVECCSRNWTPTNDRTFQRWNENVLDYFFVLIKWCQRFLFDTVWASIEHLPRELGGPLSFWEKVMVGAILVYNVNGFPVEEYHPKNNVFIGLNSQGMCQHWPFLWPKHTHVRSLQELRSCEQSASDHPKFGLHQTMQNDRGLTKERCPKP